MRLYLQVIILNIYILLGFSSVFAHTLGPDSVRTKAPQNWFNLDYLKDGVHGISTEKAYAELLSGRQSKTVVVAVIDSGVDVAHEDLQGSIWVNPKEIPDNGIDDDKNGYIDDINGWDFLGGKDGKDIRYETSELTREYIRLKKKFDGVNRDNLSEKEQKEHDTFLKYKKKFETKIEEVKQQGGEMIIAFYENYQKAKEIIGTYLSKRTFTNLDVEKIVGADVAANPKLSKAKQIYKLLDEMGLDEEKLQEAYEYFNGQLTYGLNTDYDPRGVVGDNPSNLRESKYGNNEVQGPDARHGTHVAGIIAASRKNNLGILGVAPDVKVMVVRAVPEGDERDKDVANAIRYAVDNGARVINMSFGKSISPNKEIVDEAIRYADKQGVLMIHAAGNDNEDIDIEDNFPCRTYQDGSRAENWMEIGASSWQSDTNLVADFSNFGKKMVDVFAPGVDIFSAVPMKSKRYESLSGTSMAAPVVSGVAAMLLSYFPNLSATQVKKILMESSVRLPFKKVYKPGTKDIVDFQNLSSTGGIVNAYEAIKMADAMKINN